MQSPDIVLTPITQRLLEFVRAHGGATDVARRIGSAPSLFYNYERGKNKAPSAEVLALLAETYPDFDPLFVLVGRSNISYMLPTSQLEAEVNKRTIERLERENERLWQLVLPGRTRE